METEDYFKKSNQCVSDDVDLIDKYLKMIIPIIIRK